MIKCIQKISLFFLMALFSLANAKPVLDIHHWQSKNGAPVFFVKTSQLPMLDIRLVFAAGSSEDGQDYGLSSMTNSLIGQSTKALSANQIAENFDAVGAAFSVQSGRDQASISLRTLTKENFLRPAIKTFIDVASHANFAPDSIIRAKNSTYSVIKSEQQDPGTVASNTFYQITFKGTPYAHTSSGTDHSVSTITREKILNFYHRFYVAKNMKIILVGDISEEQAKKISEDIAEQFPVGQAAPTSPMVPDTTKADLVKMPFPAAQTSLVIGQVGIARKDPDFFPLTVGNNILGGSAQTSLFYEILRNKNGLVYFAYSQFMPMLSRGPFVISLKTKNDQAPEALDLIHKISKDFIKQGPTGAQLAAAKKNFIGRFPLQISSNSKIIDVVSAMAFYDLPLNYLDTYRTNIAAVSAEDIKKAFAKHVKPENFIVVSVGGHSEKK